MSLTMREPRSIKKSLAELSTAARENLTRQRKTVATDTKRLNVHGYVNEDALLGDQFKSLEAQIASLQLEGGDGRRSRTGVPSGTAVDAEDRRGISAGVSAVGSDEVTLWNALERQYDSLLRNLVDESLEDSMRVAMCDLWEDDLRDWESSLVEYERSLDANWSWHETSQGQRRTSRRESPGKVRVQEGQMKSIVLTSRERLLLNLLSKPPSERSLDTLSEVVKLSCESIGSEDVELRDTCAEIWDIMISLCGIHPKSKGSGHETTTEDLRNVAHNALRCLEDACRRQLLHQLGVPQECVTGEELLDRLRQFCSLDGVPTFPDQSGHFWQLAYWCLRCGSPDALSTLINRLPDYQYLFPPQEFDILEAVCYLLNEKLYHTSRSRGADEDSFWQGEEIRVARPSESQQQQRRRVTLDDFLDLLSTIRIPLYEVHSTLPILISIVQPDGPTVSLREYMPNATAEDFLWYNLHLATLKPSSSLPQAISKLQRRVVQAGPKHFGSGSGANPNNLNFAKIASMALAPTAAIDWLLQARPELSILCLQWVVYLTQLGLCGSQDSVIALFLPDLHQFSGSLSISSAFSEILINGHHDSPLASSSPDAALQWCELLPFKARAGIISSILKSVSLRLFNDRSLEAELLGTINEDGSGKGGLLYRTLMSRSWDSNLNEREREKVEARRDFEGLIASLAEQASDSGYLMSAVRLSYLICQDRSCMKFLLKVFADPDFFPSDKQLAPQQLERQKEALKFFTIFEGRIMSDELQDLQATFEVLRIARQAVAVYQSSSQGLFSDAWSLIIGSKAGLDLFPHSGLITQWKNSELESHLPRLIEVCARCLQSSLQASLQSRDARQGSLATEGIREKAEVLLDSCTQLAQRSLGPNPEAIRILRNIATAR